MTSNKITDKRKIKKNFIFLSIFLSCFSVGLFLIEIYRGKSLSNSPNNSCIQQLDSTQKFIQGEAIINKGLTGKNVKIGVIDIGFYGADNDNSLKNIFANKQIVKSKDFLDTLKANFYSASSTLDYHGTNVLRYIGGNDGCVQYGLATNALFYLARTDHGTKEFRKEEDYFLEALKWFKSEGVRLVNVSIGYSIGFDNPSENYSPLEMDGKTSLVSSACQEFILKSNFIIVAAAGNNGNAPWKIVTAPADVEGVITVGALDKFGNKDELSSVGAHFSKYLKPNVSCYNSLSGTSFTAPIITGLIACVLESNPDLSNDKIKELVESSGHLYPYGNNLIGYGIPNTSRILKKLGHKETVRIDSASQILTNKLEITLDSKSMENPATVYHKRDKWFVLMVDQIVPINGQLIIRKPTKMLYTTFVKDDTSALKYLAKGEYSEVRRTTVVSNGEVIEIKWN